MLLSLTPVQVDEYLASGGEQLAGVRKTVQDNKDLQEIAQSPLLLSVMSLTYQGRPVEMLPDVTNGKYQQLYDDYVEAMLERKRGEGKTKFSPEQTKRWLSCIVWERQR